MILEYDIPDFRPPIFKTSIYRAPPYTVHNSFPPKSTLNGGSTVLNNSLIFILWRTQMKTKVVR